MTAPKTILDLFLTRRTELVNYAANITGDRASAEDIVQEAWARIGAITQAHALEEPAAYLFRIVRNLALDGRRRRAFEQRHFLSGIDDEAAQVASDIPSPEAAALSRDDLRLTLEVIEKMPDRMRIAVEMHRMDGAKLKDIAARLDISVTTAHELVAEAIRRCRVRLRQQG